MGGSYATIDAGAGTDLISLLPNTAMHLIDAGDGNDHIINDHSDDVTIYAGAGDDTIHTSGLRDFADGGDGNDSLVNYQSYTTLNGGNGNDF